MASTWGTTPRASIALERERRGRRALIEGCRALVRGEPVDDELLLALAGPAAAPFTGGAEREDAYWMRVWGARGLLWEWDTTALPDILAALSDRHWRVREMALLVVKRHRLDAALDRVSPLLQDPVPRVRTAAAKALQALADG